MFMGTSWECERTILWNDLKAKVLFREDMAEQIHKHIMS
jgi:hypothetical protein